MRGIFAMTGGLLLAFQAADAGAVTHLPPCQGGLCTNPVVDGVVGDIEYANGVGYPLSNFDAGGRTAPRASTSRRIGSTSASAPRPGVGPRPPRRPPDLPRRRSARHVLRAGRRVAGQQRTGSCS